MNKNIYLETVLFNPDDAHGICRQQGSSQSYNDVMTWKCFPYSWSFVREPWVSGGWNPLQVTGEAPLVCNLVLVLNKLLKEQSIRN